MLRRALDRAGIVEGYVHVCHKKDCGYSEPALDAASAVAPSTTAGADPAAVQRILRHRDARVTMKAYGHLTAGYLGAY